MTFHFLQNPVIATSGALLTLLSIVLPACLQNLHAEVIDRVVAVVNDDVITMSELQKEVSEQYKIARKKTELSDSSRIKISEQTLNAIIDRRLLEQKADELSINVSENDIDSAFAESVVQSGVPREIFLQKMREAGISENSYRNNIRMGMLRGKLLSAGVHQKVIITDEMVEDYYKKNYEAQEKKQFYTLLQIGCSWGENSSTERAKAKALSTAQKARDEVLSGADFNETAQKYSDLPSAVDGGHIGSLALSDMAQLMASSIKQLKPGQCSKIIEIADSFQFFQLLSIDTENKETNEVIAQIKDEIRETLYQKQLESTYKDWVSNLKKGAYIKKMGSSAAE